MQRRIAGLMLVVTLAACAQQETEKETQVTVDTAMAAPAAATGQLLDPNTATPEELATIPGVDSTLAAQIVAGRPFADMRAVNSVLAAQLDETQRDSVFARMWRPVDVNTATAEELELIPGVGERMRHEFEEYRPFQSVAHFRSEIGKYVDDAELDRLLRYVVIP